MKKIISNIVFGIVICMCGYLFVANILHVLYLNKYEPYNFDDKPIASIKDNIKTLEANITKISALDTSVFTSTELETIKQNLNSALDNANNSKLLKYKGNQKIYLKDLLEIDLESQLNISGNIALLQTLAKYDESINNYLEVYKYDFVSSAYNGDSSFQEAIQAYKYNTRDFFNTNMYESVNTRVLARVFSLSYYVIKENYLAELVLKIGGNNNE